MTTIIKKVFQHGGSQAINLPKEFTEHLAGKEVIVETTANQVIIRNKDEMNTLEADPLFAAFIQAIAIDALKHPEKLRGLNEVWDKEWDELLEGVTADDEGDE